jgi:hypothetical protein
MPQQFNYDFFYKLFYVIFLYPNNKEQHNRTFVKLFRLFQGLLMENIIHDTQIVFYF